MHRSIARSLPAWRVGLLAALAAPAIAAQTPAAPAVAPTAAAGTAAAPIEAGTWKEQDFDFDFIGFTAHYTCSGLRERVLLVLRLLGARADSVSATTCADAPGFFDPFPRVRAHFAALAPAAPGAAADGAPGTTTHDPAHATAQAKADAVAHASAGAGGAVPGQWRSVNLVGLGRLDPTECELLAQVLDEVVPLFATRNAAPPPRCLPHQETRTAALRLEVFAPSAAAPN